MLQRIHIENFKSLKNVTLDLQRVNVLIGPNNSGKTNVLKALELFVKETSFSNSQIEYFNTISFNRKGEKLLSKLSWKNVKASNQLSYYHRIFAVSKVINGVFTDLKPTPEFVKTDSIENEESITIDTNSLEVQNNFEFFISLKQSLLGIYKPDSSKMVGYHDIGGTISSLNFDASNIVSFLELLRDEYRDEFYKLERDLKACLPEFSYISFRKSNEKGSVKKELGLYNSLNQDNFWSDELSEGVLYFLALLCIIHQPNPPKLLLLEEPERGIHPRRIKEIIGFIKQLAYEKEIQVIMTTHSPLVLDEFAETPESVFIFDKDEEGATSIKNLQKDVIEPENAERAKKGMEAVNYTDALGENWTIGFLGGVPK